MRMPLYIKVLPVYAAFAVVFLAPIVHVAYAQPTLQVSSSEVQSPITAPSSQVEPAAEMPESVSIPSVGISLAILPRETDLANNTWKVDDGVEDSLT